jgi:hypothetical protein
LFGGVNNARARFAKEERVRDRHCAQVSREGGGIAHKNCGAHSATRVGCQEEFPLAVEIEEDDTPMLLDLFFDRGLFPSYAFPTDLCSFYVFERDGKTVRIKERPQQSKDKALSEYAPGRLLVINKKTYRVGGSI